MTHKSVLLNEVAEFFRVNSSSCGDNSVLGMQFRTCGNFQVSTDFNLVESPKVSTNTKATPQFAEFASEARQPSLRLRFCESQNLSENQAKNAESTLDSAPLTFFTQEANSSIVDEFLRSCEASDADRTNGSSRKRGEHEREKSPQDEFAELILIDATLGLGGHSERLLDENPTLKIIGIDKDKYSLEFAKKRLARFGERFSAVQGSFAKQIKQILRTHKNIYGILADLGISSPQVDNLERGFSFESPTLDMRMDVDASLDAKFILNNYSKDDLARIFREFGEIKGSEKIANLIAESRRKSPIKSGEDLCKIITKHAKWKEGIHPATLIFQAIRLEVNNELGDLEEFLENIAHLKGTKVAIISFHSLEDRLVKRAFKAWSAACVCDESAMKCECGGKNERGQILTKKPIIPSEREISQNKRARSAKMRCFKFYE